MKKDIFYEKLVRKMEEVTIVPPENVGPFTGVYKVITSHLKVNPWRSAGTLAFIATILLYALVGASLIRIASILQFGF